LIPFPKTETIDFHLEIKKKLQKGGLNPVGHISALTVETVKG